MVLGTRKKLGIMYGDRYQRDTVMIILPHMQITNHLHCMPESNMLHVSYTSIKRWENIKTEEVVNQKIKRCSYI